jgi:putative selenium metabolism hydrolase
MQDTGLKPDYAVICEPSSNQIALGHNGKAQIIVKTHGISAHGSAPEKGKNAVYEMAEIIQRVEETNLNLEKINGRKGTLVLSRISSTGVSLNAVPSECEIYLDRRLVPGEDEDTVRAEMEKIIAGKDAEWEIDTVHRTTWTGEAIVYHPLHPAWEIGRDHHLAQAFIQAFGGVFGKPPADEDFTYWDFSTNAVALVSKGVPCIGLGPGDSKLAHMRDERCPLEQIIDACALYTGVIAKI